MNLILLLVISTTFLITVEIVKRRFLLPSSITRRISHIGAALIAAISPLFIDKNLIVFACLGFAGVMLISRRFTFLSSLHSVSRKTFGEVFLPLGEAFSAALFLPQGIKEFQFGVLVMGISDALAGFIGERFGSHRIIIFGNEKSMEGSLVFFTCTLILTFLFIPVFGFALIVVSLLLTLVELVLGHGVDNLALPITGALLLKYIMS